jgi:hypothetical protein
MYRISFQAVDNGTLLAMGKTSPMAYSKIKFHPITYATISPTDT